MSICCDVGLLFCWFGKPFNCYVLSDQLTVTYVRLRDIQQMASRSCFFLCSGALPLCPALAAGTTWGLDEAFISIDVATGAVTRRRSPHHPALHSAAVFDADARTGRCLVIVSSPTTPPSMFVVAPVCVDLCPRGVL